jgi:hypothetical protein
MPADPRRPRLRPSSRPDDGQGAVVVESKTQKTEPPRMYQVVLLNDDYTPMEFVVMVLQEYFNRDLETATQIMLKIHHEGPRRLWCLLERTSPRPRSNWCLLPRVAAATRCNALWSPHDCARARSQSAHGVRRGPTATP